MLQLPTLVVQYASWTHSLSVTYLCDLIRLNQV